YVTALVGPQTGERVLGMLIDETLTLPGAPPAAPVAGGLTLPAIRAVTRIQRLVSTMTSARDRLVMDAFADLFVRLPALGYGTIEFDMSDAKRDRLVAAGRTAMAAWFDRPQPSESAAPFGPGSLNAYVDRAARALLAP
ncbi:MAG: hypothetical protein ACRC1H_08390, partial [Caldilineaceae bacterium]